MYYLAVSLFFLSQGLVFWPGLGDLFVCQNSREFCASNSQGQILVCIVKFECLAQFPVDDLPHPVVFGLFIFLCKFAVFT